MTNYTGGSGGAALAATGAGSVTVAGIAFEQLWLLFAAVLLVAAGAALVRAKYRADKGVSDA